MIHVHVSGPITHEFVHYERNAKDTHRRTNMKNSVKMLSF